MQWPSFLRPMNRQFHRQGFPVRDGGKDSVKPAVSRVRTDLSGGRGITRERRACKEEIRMSMKNITDLNIVSKAWEFFCGDEQDAGDLL